MPAVDIPEHDIRDLIAVLPISLLHLLVEEPFLIPAGINLHVRDNDNGRKKGLTISASSDTLYSKQQRFDDLTQQIMEAKAGNHCA